MTIAICHQNGSIFWTEAKTLLHVRQAIDNGEPLECWWVAGGPSPTRYDETVLFAPEKIDLIRTESDDD